MFPPRLLRIPAETVAFMRSLHPQLKRKVRAALKAILTNPLSGKALKDNLEGLLSFSIGKFRIVYRTTPETIDVIAIGLRKTIYEETLRLLKKGKEGAEKRTRF